MATRDFLSSRFLDGHYGYSVASVPTEASVAQCVSREDTSVWSAANGSVFFLEKIVLSCTSGTNISVFDESGVGGSRLFGPIFCTSSSVASFNADFGKDPMIVGSGDISELMCISTAAAGSYNGFIKGYWGPKGS